MASKPASGEARITPIEKDDYDEWERLFRLYIEFYKSSLPDAQYPRTFERILNPEKDLHGLVLRDSSDRKKLYGLAHYFPMQTPWAEEQLMHFNDLYIDHELRGKGYGRKIIQAVAEEAKKQGCTRLQWTTQHGNPARKLYDELATCEFVHYRMNLKDS
ncbi:acyl-CoA N-acyltransferase [Macroventuria anomochaeta]|uniref:Acyl-CoA N-acyltransferase n=1 Tax=Macroventuria anomochaeta TaxID=301207 RepID=A0ACB6RX16_9PLEO|nr:acyl-CoA N-acyltransferase [Macroventuria anomochaeta]KAF2625432.1 acyl-CoA N-acyltransferase [Macroventuria anomochaeta]